MNDDKTAKDYNIEGGSVLHLVRHSHVQEASDTDLFNVGTRAERGLNIYNYCAKLYL